jgi:transposase InsO family protein
MGIRLKPSRNLTATSRIAIKKGGHAQEAFVKTFKRDYVYVHDRPDARTVLSQLPAWFEDYNESHPHKTLQMKSPREFRRSHQTAACPA